ncbi:probable serine/threonine-protein kinase clkA [Olea europaea var. sylvestris]|uniref:probable serine/threonine-protein kinase clkA n=1 Tax=Olea europaea var. sylvestris TaxID=158386 RepID=UPI000C1CDC16|nr:probable serine/threonine-protein kinase clkA [Olea europaea var. sylvestris]
MEAPGVEFDAVLEFLRKNGLSESESALMEDIMEKSQLGAFDFEKFLFPMVPPPPVIKLPANRRRPLAVASVDEGGSTGSSDEEFVSLGSSTTELCSSDFTNPYGIHTTTRPTSQASSDRLSQFGTARDYPDFDMQNDLFWYKENDEDYAMPPLFVGRDSDGDPSEDKYITTVQIEKPFADQVDYSFISEEYTNYSEKGLPLMSVENVKDEAYKDHYDLNYDFRLEQSDEKHGEHCKHLKVVDANDVQFRHSRGQPVDSQNDFTKRKSTYDWVGGFNTKDNIPNEHDNFEIKNDEVIAGEPCESEAAADEEGGLISDELLMYDNTEEDYEIFDLRIIHRKNRTGFEENKDLPIVLNSVIAGRYYVTEYLGSAAFSKVVQAHDLHLGMDVCLKIIKNDKDFFDQSLDEIKLLKFVNKHDPADEHHILRLYDYFYHQEHLFIVTELLRANLYEFQKFNRESGGEPYFTLQRLQVITQQCLEALAYLHDLGIIHCDLKPENILIRSYRRCEIKVIDLGSSCFQKDNLSLYVQSRSYRAPEVILGLSYDQKIDLWSLGCILAELCSGEVLFPNEAIPMLLARMIGTLGPIDMDILQRGQETHKYFTKEYDLYHINEETDQLEYIIPEETSLEHQLQVSDSGFVEFVRYLLETNPKRRPTARQALEHSWLSQSYAVNSF